MKYDEPYIKQLISAILIIISLLSVNDLKAKSPGDKLLYDSIRGVDSAMFAAFNSRNFEVFRNYFSEDLEIYQDNIGVRNYKEAMTAFRGLFDLNYVLSRSLEKGSLEVYPVKDFGAIETGMHTFCHWESGKQDCGTFKFVHIWKHRNGEWKITRIITYDH
jgi:hypothetical protein